MTALTRLIDAYRLYLSRGVDDCDAITLAIDDARIDGDNFLTIAANCFPHLVAVATPTTPMTHYESFAAFMEH